MYLNRPKRGRMLLAKENGKCKSYYTKKQCADDWYKYYDLLSRLISEYK